MSGREHNVHDFYGQYVSCALPAEDEELVLLLQQHKHIAQETKLAVSTFPSHLTQKPSEFPENTDVEHSKTVKKGAESIEH